MKCLEFMVSVNIVLKRGSVRALQFFLYHCKTSGMNIKKKKKHRNTIDTQVVLFFFV